ncbi:MAG: nucleoside hydrolase [Anaerolineales bacterium]|nr:nucleoside hydrolase [Anaerolineae bacterium]PWB70320.1 MAG: nucleoside hydrolase [Anaerolineales bacterium]
MKKHLLNILIAVSLLVTSCGGPSPAPDPSLIQIQTPQPVIFDTDMAHEDIFSALFLLSHPNVDVRAITVTGAGEVHCEPGVEYALGLVTLSGHENIPVACGRETPLAGNHVFPAEWRQSADEGYGVAMPKGDNPSRLSASELIIDLVQNSDEPITIVAVGPLTNIAEVIQKEPGIVTNIKAIYIMGGAVEVEGNVGNSGVGINNKYAEWNIYIDPVAANIVFKSGIPIVLVPLDATNNVPITRRFYNALGDHLNTPAANLVYDILAANLDFVDSGGFQFWDSLTSAIFTDPSITTIEEFQLIVVEEDGLESGYTKPDPNGATIKVATSVKREKFESLLLTVLNWEH